MKRYNARKVLLMLALTAGCSSEKATSPVQVGATGKTAIASSADGVEIEYETHGDGPVALVFVHGWMCDRAHWRGQIETFSADHTVVTLDLAGHGKSGDGRDEWTFDRFGADVRAVVEALDLPRVILVGHSMGGPVALAAASRMPERVLGVVGVDTLHNVEATMDPDRWEQLMAQYEADFGATCEGFIQFMFPEPTADPGLPEWVRENMCDADPATAVAVGRQMATLDQAAMLAAAGVPVRCINSAKTGVTDIEANKRHGDFDATLMEDVGHFVMLERPGDFNRLLAEAIEELTGA